MNHYFGTEFFVIYIVLIWTLSSEVNGKNNSVERNGNLKTNQGGEFFRRNFTFGISELRKVFSPIDLKTFVIHFYFCKKNIILQMSHSWSTSTYILPIRKRGASTHLKQNICIHRTHKHNIQLYCNYSKLQPNIWCFMTSSPGNTVYLFLEDIPRIPD